MCRRMRYVNDQANEIRSRTKLKTGATAPLFTGTGRFRVDKLLVSAANGFLEQIMRSIWRSGFAASVIVLLIAAESVLLPSAAQIDPAAAQKRFQDLYEAGNYSAALAEAQKAEATAKRAGTNNFAYVSALNDLARAHQALGRYADAASMFKQVYLAYYKGTCHRPIPA
jgi:tetratricopeptide (TPR) repeat protein